MESHQLPFLLRSQLPVLVFSHAPSREVIIELGEFEEQVFSGIRCFGGERRCSRSFPPFGVYFP